MLCVCRMESSDSQPKSLSGSHLLNSSRQRRKFRSINSLAVENRIRSQVEPGWSSLSSRFRHAVGKGVGSRIRFEVRKNDHSRPGLEQALNLHFDLLADGRLAIVDHDHGPVRQVTNSLAFVLAFSH